jgi:hypothetical protein
VFTRAIFLDTEFVSRSDENDILQEKTNYYFVPNMGLGESYSHLDTVVLVIIISIIIICN